MFWTKALILQFFYIFFLPPRLLLIRDTALGHKPQQYLGLFSLERRCLEVDRHMVETCKAKSSIADLCSCQSSCKLHLQPLCYNYLATAPSTVLVTAKGSCQHRRAHTANYILPTTTPELSGWGAPLLSAAHQVTARGCKKAYGPTATSTSRQSFSAQCAEFTIAFYHSCDIKGNMQPPTNFLDHHGGSKDRANRWFPSMTTAVILVFLPFDWRPQQQKWAIAASWGDLSPCWL